MSDEKVLKNLEVIISGFARSDEPEDENYRFLSCGEIAEGVLFILLEKPIKWNLKKVKNDIVTFEDLIITIFEVFDHYTGRQREIQNAGEEREDKLRSGFSLAEKLNEIEPLVPLLQDSLDKIKLFVDEEGEYEGYPLNVQAYSLDFDFLPAFSDLVIREYKGKREVRIHSENLFLSDFRRNGIGAKKAFHILKELEKREWKYEITVDEDSPSYYLSVSFTTADLKTPSLIDMLVIYKEMIEEIRVCLMEEYKVL